MKEILLKKDFLSGHDTNPDKPKYRPLFLEHFDKKEAETTANPSHEDHSDSEILQEVPNPSVMQVPPKNTPQQIQQMQSVGSQFNHEEQQRFQSHLELQLNQISAIQQHPQQILHMQLLPTAPSAPSNEQIVDNLQQAQLQYHQQRMNVLDSAEYEFVSETHFKIPENIYSILFLAQVLVI